MYTIYNKRALTRNERFIKALIYGGLATLGMALVYGIVSSITPFEFSIVYVLFGYGIGYVIRTMGRGVQPRFSVLGAVLAILCFLVGDLLSMYGMGLLLHPIVLIQGIFFIIPSYLSANLNSILGLAFRAYGVYAAYISSRIV